ncbi:MAG: hypothetical protein A2201_06290 [Alicyclobacillus sp. RIFOXYA1_FULL_53_8]|nr:MAG: hypothetical protein A2201_06290 [Alicyclobacillus sp. RIFOXYA1_FULL_53_8]
MRWKLLLATIFAVLVATFTLLNSTKVQVDFLFTSAHTNLVYVILLSVLLGMILMSFLWSTQTWKLRKLARTAQRQLQEVEAELAAFKAAGPATAVHTGGSAMESTRVGKNDEPSSAPTVENPTTSADA